MHHVRSTAAIRSALPRAVGLASAILAILVLVATPAKAGEVKAFSVDTRALYQPNEVLEARVTDLGEFGTYLQEVDRVCTAFFAEAKVPESLVVIIAIRPGKTSKVWFISSLHAELPKEREALREQIEKVPPCAVTVGPVAVAS